MPGPVPTRLGSWYRDTFPTFTVYWSEWVSPWCHWWASSSLRTHRGWSQWSERKSHTQSPSPKWRWCDANMSPSSSFSEMMILMWLFLKLTLDNVAIELHEDTIPGSELADHLGELVRWADIDWRWCRSQSGGSSPRSERKLTFSLNYIGTKLWTLTLTFWNVEWDEMSAQGWAGAGQCNIIAIDSILTLLTLSDDDCDTRLWIQMYMFVPRTRKSLSIT